MDLDVTELPGWYSRAACLGLPQVLARDPWFAGSEEGYADALAICGACPVRGDCLETALVANITDGVWGGRTPRERAALSKQRYGDRRRNRAA